MQREYRFYVAKVVSDKFKFGISKNVVKRLGNIATTGYGRPKLIATSDRLLTETEAREFEAHVKNDIVGNDLGGEYCDMTHIGRVLRELKAKHGVVPYQKPTVAIGKAIEFKPGDWIDVEVTQEIIDCAVCETTGYCMYAQSLRVLGVNSPNVQFNGTSFSLDGKRYYCQTPNEACVTLQAFDKDKSNIKPHTMRFQVMRVEPIKPKSVSVSPKPASKPRKATSKKTKPRGRHHGLASFTSVGRAKLAKMLKKVS